MIVLTGAPGDVIVNGMKNEMNAATLIGIAAKYVDIGSMKSSVKLCLDDARKLVERGDYVYAARRALCSLSYSIGMLHPEYVAAKLLVS
jgi:hypothetical protein